MLLILGTMTITALLFVVSVFFFSAKNNNLRKNGNRYSDKFLFPLVVGWVSLVATCIAIIAYSIIAGCAYLKKTVDMQKYMNEKSLTQRLLMEDYNPSNLEKALAFNNKQKLIKVENSHWLTAYGTSFVYTDTIAIPATNFMPSQRIIIKGE